jgi:hypothetical protein
MDLFSLFAKKLMRAPIRQCLSDVEHGYKAFELVQSYPRRRRFNSGFGFPGDSQPD